MEAEFTYIEIVANYKGDEYHIAQERTLCDTTFNIHLKNRPRYQAQIVIREEGVNEFTFFDWAAAEVDRQDISWDTENLEYLLTRGMSLLINIINQKEAPFVE